MEPQRYLPSLCVHTHLPKERKHPRVHFIDRPRLGYCYCGRRLAAGPAIPPLPLGGCSVRYRCGSGGGRLAVRRRVRELLGHLMLKELLYSRRLVMVWSAVRKDSSTHKAIIQRKKGTKKRTWMSLAEPPGGVGSTIPEEEQASISALRDCSS